MELIVLSIHLLVCMCLIGLVLLQRSEGGALGMGGGGGGALMSGRGAADALAKMTSVAGGFFIVTSLGLTLISGAASNTNGRSVMDLLPTQSAPATTTAPEAPAETPATTTTPDPTEGRAPATNQFTLGPGNAAAATPASTGAATRAGPIDNRAVQTAAATPQRQPANTGATTQRTTANPPAQQRSTPATTQPAATQRTTPATTAPATTAPNGPVSGIDLTTDTQLGAESGDSDNGVAAVRRERAGPDQ